MQIIRNVVVGCVMTVAAFVVIGCSTQSDPNSPQQSEIANKICPIMEGEVDPKGETVAWKGQTIGFCCDVCVPKWNGLTDAQKQGKLDAVNRPDAQPKEMHNDPAKKKVG